MDGGNYVPNNPQFGLQLECNWTPSIATAPVQTANGCAVQVSSNCSSAGGGAAGAGVADSAASVPGDDLSPWPEDMGSFTLPLDLDPLPTLFPFSPCATINNNNYKTDNSFHSPPSMTFREAKPSSGDVADVLLSLKHAVVHPEQEQQQQIYHPQVLLSPNNCPGTYCDQSFPHQQPSASVFPSMSVNVSMNMTMHGYHPAAAAYPTTTEITYPQVQWNSGPQFSPSTQGLLSPGYGATYSFTADFRPPQHQEPPSAVFSAAYKPAMSLSSPRRKHHHGLPVHFEEESQKPNVCRICGKSYARPSTLKTHLRTHSGEKPYRCIDCNKSFSQAANLTAHVRTHSGEKPFRCPVCDRRFSQSSSVTTHMRTHSGERPYRCRLCKKAFSDSSTLTKHLRIHSGEKPYECKLCLLRFSQSGNLNRHMRVHGNNGTMVIT